MSATDSSPVVTVPVLSSTIVSSSWLRSRISAAANQQPEAGAASGADEDRDRRRQPQRARAGHDQHRDRGVHASLQVHRGEHALQALAGEHPRKRGERGEHEHAGHEVARDLIRQPLDLRLGGLRALDERHELGERGVGADGCCARAQHPIDVQRRRR